MKRLSALLIVVAALIGVATPAAAVDDTAPDQVMTNQAWLTYYVAAGRCPFTEKQLNQLHDKAKTLAERLHTVPIIGASGDTMRGLIVNDSRMRGAFDGNPIDVNAFCILTRTKL
jgi:hypothetical protein